MRILFAGGESHFDRLIQHGAKSILFSFLFMRGQKKKVEQLLEKVKEHHEGRYFMLDSGAYSIMSKYLGGHHSGKKADFDYDTALKESEELYYDYLDFLYKYGHLFDVCANMDLQELFDTETVFEWDEKFLEYERATGGSICYVFHDPVDIPYKREFMEKYKFLGVASSVSNYKKWARMFTQAGKKVHLFGMTDTKEIAKIKCTSADSVTWVMATKFGATFYFRGGKMKRYDHHNKQRRYKLKAQCQKLGVNFQDWITENPNTALEWSIKQWTQFQIEIDKQSSNRYAKEVFDRTGELI